MAEKFHIGTVLTFVQDVMMSPDGTTGMCAMVKYMTGDIVSEVALIRITDEVRPHLLKAHPWLADIDTSHVNPENFQESLQKIVEQYGEYVEIEKLPEDAHTVIDATEELYTMAKALKNDEFIIFEFRDENERD